MQNLKKFLNENQQFQPANSKSDWLTFKGTGVHNLKLLKGEPHTKPNFRTKQPEKGILLTFLEGGQEKKYFIAMYKINKETGKQEFTYLTQRFADIEEGTDLVIEYKQKPGSYEGFLDVKVATPVIQQNEIPIINETPQGEYNITDIINDEANANPQANDGGEWGV